MAKPGRPPKADNQPQTEIEGFACPSIFKNPVFVGGDCPNPLDQSSMSDRLKIESITRMRGGQPNNSGSDVRVKHIDGTMFDICGAPIAFKYKLNPIEIKLDNAEVRTLGNQLWGLEQGQQYEAAKMARIELDQRRADAHGQKEEVRKITGKLRATAEEMARRNAWDKTPDETQDEPEAFLSSEAEDAAEVVAGIVGR